MRFLSLEAPKNTPSKQIVQCMVVNTSYFGGGISNKMRT